MSRGYHITVMPRRDDAGWSWMVLFPSVGSRSGFAPTEEEGIAQARIAADEEHARREAIHEETYTPSAP